MIKPTVTYMDNGSVSGLNTKYYQFWRVREGIDPEAVRRNAEQAVERYGKPQIIYGPGMRVNYT